MEPSLLLSIGLSALLIFYALAGMRRRTFLRRAEATVTAASCSSGECELTLSYTVGRAEGPTLVTGVTVWAEGEFAVGDTLDVYYDPARPRHVSLYSICPDDSESYMMLVAGLIVLSVPFLLPK